MSDKLHDPYAAIRFKEFRFFISGKLLLTIAVLMQEIVASWMIYDQTKDPLSLGLIGLTEAIPSLLLALPGGYLADKFSRRKLMLVATMIMLFASIILSIYAHTSMAYGIFPIYCVIFLIGTARGIYNPAQASLWPQLVDKKFYVNSSVWNSGMWQIGAVTGPALGGLFYGLIGAKKTLVVVNVLLLVTILLYSAIKHHQVEKFNHTESVQESLKKGISYFFKQPILLSAISLDLFAVLFGGAVAMLPVFADQILSVGPQGLGILRSAPAIGAVAMSIFQAYHPPKNNAGIKMLLCVAGFGLCMIGFALSEAFWLSFTFLLLSGIFDNVSVVIRSTILQLYTPNEMRGRVSAVNSIFVGSSNELGAFESGVSAKFMGLVPSVIFGGCMTLIVTIIAYRLAPSLKKLTLP
jgi:MFS family permease